jgi:hypothetical protein
MSNFAQGMFGAMGDTVLLTAGVSPLSSSVSLDPGVDKSYTLARIVNGGTVPAFIAIGAPAVGFGGATNAAPTAVIPVVQGTPVAGVCVMPNAEVVLQIPAGAQIAATASAAGPVYVTPGAPVRGL